MFYERRQVGVSIAKNRERGTVKVTLLHEACHVM